MAVYGVYSEEEKKKLEEFKNYAETQIGWSRNLKRRVATEEAMLSNAFAIDPWNPLWRDKKYAEATRWGGIIAFPSFMDTFMPRISMPDVARGDGFRHFIWIGEDWEFFQPVRLGDSFKSFCRRPEVMDGTSKDGKGPRKYKVLNLDADIINQKDELTSTIKFYHEIIILPEVPKQYSMPEYGYTFEEQDYIDRIMSEEEIRGSKIRYWDDVNVGDEPKPIVLGPTNTWFSATVTGIPQINPEDVRERRVLKYKEATGAGEMRTFLKDPNDGLLYPDAGRHMSDRAAQAEGEPHAFLFGKVCTQAMLRLVTNWMGDDGFITRYNWRHLYRNPLGDTLIGNGKVTKKYIKDGQHFVELAVWLENLRGNITEASVATVALCSKDKPFTWK